MYTSENIDVKQRLLNEIVSTLEFIDFLKYEAQKPVNQILVQEEKKKKELIAEYQSKFLA